MTVVKAAEADLGALSDGAAGSVRLGIYQSAGARVIPRLLPRYALDWPDARARARCRARPRPTPRCSSSWNAASSTSALPTLLLREGPFDYTEVLVDPYILFVAADSPLAGNGPVGLEDVAELPLIGHVTCRVLPRVEAALGARAAGAASGLRA